MRSRRVVSSHEVQERAVSRHLKDISPWELPRLDNFRWASADEKLKVGCPGLCETSYLALSPYLSAPLTPTSNRPLSPFVSVFLSIILQWIKLMVLPSLDKLFYVAFIISTDF